LFRWHPSSWLLQDDVKYPFGEGRHLWRAAGVWIFDIERDDLTLKRQSSPPLIISLELLRQGTALFSDMKPFKQAPLPIVDKTHTYHSYRRPEDGWDKRFQVNERQIAFCGRLLKDFAYQWRHVLRERYSDALFLKLASAIVRIWSLDFEVRERKFVKAKRIGTAEPEESLPAWPAYPGRVIHLNRCSVIMIQHLNMHAIMAHVRTDIAQAGHPNKDNLPMHPMRNCRSITYVVLSVREVMLVRSCTVAQHSHSQYTDAVPLLTGETGDTMFSDTALNYLSAMVPFADYPNDTLLERLPNELQDMVISSVSEDPIECAKTGCMLAMGREFKWKREGMDLEQRGGWSSHDRATHKASTKPKLTKESQIWFGNSQSGISYPHTKEC
jgi:hypothetical protein